jgi:hypothetical protein
MIKESVYVGVPVYNESVRTLEKFVCSLRNLRELSFECIFLVNRGIEVNDQVLRNHELTLEYLRSLDSSNIRPLAQLISLTQNYRFQILD